MSLLVPARAARGFDGRKQRHEVKGRIGRERLQLVITMKSMCHLCLLIQPKCGGFFDLTTRVEQ